MTWTWWVVPGWTSMLVALGAAIVLLRTGADRSVNRRLATVLFFEGLWMAGTSFWLVEDPELFRRIAAIAVGAMAAVPFLYLSFLGAAVGSPLVAPFRSRWAVLALGLASAGSGLAVLLFPDAYIGELYSPDWATWNFLFQPLGSLAAQTLGVASIFGLVVALHAFFRARPGSAARTQAGWFAIAFGLRDLFNIGMWLLYPIVRPVPFWGDVLANQGGAYAAIVYIGVLAYGVLRAQLFDLDLKLKVAVRSGTIGALFAVAFFTGSELLERLVPVEGTVLGLMAAGVIVLVLRPVQRFAEGVASRVLPGVEDTPDYLREQKLAVYRAALEGAHEDQVVSERERGILARLRAELDISEQVAAELERQVLAQRVGAR